MNHFVSMRMDEVATHTGDKAYLLQRFAWNRHAVPPTWRPRGKRISNLANSQGLVRLAAIVVFGPRAFGLYPVTNRRVPHTPDFPV